MKKMSFRVLLMILVSVLALLPTGLFGQKKAGGARPGPVKPKMQPAPTVEGSCDGWDTSFTTNGANDDVYAIASDGAGNFYYGGDFTTIGGIPAAGIAKWNSVTNTWSALGSGLSGASISLTSVKAIAISGSDVYVGGDFTSAGGTPVKSIAKWNGTSWSALGTGLGNGVYMVNSLAFFGGDLYVGGTFNTFNGAPATGVARWNGSSWSNVGAFGPYANSLIVKDGKLYAGGGGGVMSWDGTSWTTLGALEGTINDLAFKGTELWAVGDARIPGDPTYPTYINIMKWNGTAWTYVGYFHNAGVYSVAVYGSDLYFGTSVTREGGQSPITDGLVKYDGTNWTGISSGTQGGSHRVNEILVDGNKMYVGGNFARAGGIGARNIATLTNGTTWAGFPGTGLDSAPTAFAASGNDLYVGGGFVSAGPATANHIAKWNGSAFSVLGSGLDTWVAGPIFVNAVAVAGNKVYVGGAFTYAGGMQAIGIAVWNGSSWSALGSGIIGGSVSAIAVAPDGVYVGGSFLTAEGVTVNRIAKWNGSSWSALGSGLDGPVSLIKVVGNDIYVTGSFENAGGVPAHYIAKWNGTNWVGLNSGLLVSIPHTIAFAGSDLYVAAETTTITTDSYISKYDGTTWTPIGTGMGGRGVRTMAVIGTDVYITGGFNSVAGVPVSRVAKWNGTSWSALGGGLPGSMGSNNVKIIAVGSDLIASGDFTTGAGAPATYVAKWNGSAWSALGSGLNEPADMMMTTGGDVYFGGSFTTAGCNLSPYFARWRHTIWTGSTGPDWHTGTNWGSGSVPSANAGVTLSATDASITSTDVTLSSLIVTNNRTLTIGAGRTVTVNGDLDIRNGFVAGPGNLVVKGDLNLNGGSISNVASLTVDRHFTMNGNISGPGTITVKGDLNMGGNISNTTSLTVEHNLMLNGNSISNAGPVTVGGNLALNGGSISGTGMVTVTSCATAALTGGSNTSFIASPLTRCVNNAGIYRFPIGTGSVYSPVDLANVTGSANFTVEAHPGPYGVAGGLSPNRLQRWWSTANGGIAKADITFNYVNADVVGTEEYYRVFRVSGGSAVRVPTNFQPTANIATIPGITAFADFTLAEAESSIQMMSGRLIARGRGAENVEITMTDALHNTYRTKTNQMGYFRFDNMPTIRTYDFSFKSKRFQLPDRPVMFDGDGLLTIIGP